MQLRRQSEGRIFISYRRADTGGQAGRLSDTLGDYFGEDRVFRDIEGIEGGADFGSVIEKNLSGADAMIVMIGPGWLSASDEGRRRLDDPDDWVAAEVAAALQGDVPVYPVLVDDASMPRAADLPDSLKALARRNAVSIADERWREDTTRLAKIVALDIPGSVAERRLWLLRRLIVATLVVAAAFTVATVGASADDLLEDVGLLTEAIALAEDDGGLTNQILVPAWLSAVNYVAMMAAAILLILSAPLLDPGSRRWVQASAAVGVFGSFFGLVMYWLLDVTSETVGLVHISTVAILLMLGLTTLSGFRPR